MPDQDYSTMTNRELDAAVAEGETMQGWTDDRIDDALELLGFEGTCVTAIKPDGVNESKWLPLSCEEARAAIIESACRTELKRRGNGRYKEVYIPESSVPVGVDVKDVLFFGDSIADAMIAALKAVTQ